MTNSNTVAYGALLMRAATGALFVAHGLTKLFVFTPVGTAGFFESLGLPGWLGIATMLFEIAGGLALILGLATRLVALVSVPVLLGAAITAHWANGFGWSNAGGGWEYPVMWAAMMAALALIGDGAHALWPLGRR